MRSDSGIFNFVKWLRRRDAGAGQGEAEGALPLQARVAGPRWSSQQAQAVNAAANRALAPEALKLLELEVMGCYESVPTNGCSQTAPQNSLQSMRVWPGLRLIGAGGNTQGRLCGRGGSGAGRSEAGQRHAAEEPEAAAGTRPSHAVTYASCRDSPSQPRPPGPRVLPPHAAPPVRGRLTGHKLLEA